MFLKSAILAVILGKHSIKKVWNVFVFPFDLEETFKIFTKIKLLKKFQTLFWRLLLVCFNISTTETKKSDKRTTMTMSSTAEVHITTTAQTKTMTPDKEVSVKSKVNEDKEWPIREMIAILGKELLG